MKSFSFYLFLLLQITVSIFSFSPRATGQDFTTNGSPMEYKMRDLDQFRNGRDRYSYEVSYLINGQRVLGTPFLYYDWLPGTVNTKDGRAFTDYTLKYDAYNQALFFKNGKDSLEASDEINEFTLVNSLQVFRFINAKQIKNSKAKGYFEVLVNGKEGMLLKLTQKTVSEATFGLPIYSGKKHFENFIEYFFYNAVKANKLLLSNESVSSALGLTREKAEELNLNSYNFLSQDELVKFFKVYFHS